MNLKPVTQVAIIGAGPIGIELAVALKRNQISYVIIEAGCIGSTISWYAPGTTFFSSADRIAISGYPLETPNQAKATREEYLSHLRGVARAEQINCLTFSEVVGIDREKNDFKLSMVRCEFGYGDPRRSYKCLPKSEEVSILSAERVVLAIGDMHKPSLIGVKGEELRHVSHYLKDPHCYFGRKVLVVGGKNSAAEAALRLCRAGAKVTMSYRRAELAPSVKYWIRPELEGLIARGEIEFLPSSTLQQIYKDKVTVLLGDSSKVDLKVDDVLLMTGYKQDDTLFEKCGILLSGESRKPQFNLKTMETNQPGIYVAGTAIAGSQKRHTEFIETSHIHIERIVAHILGKAPPKEEVNVKSVDQLER